MVWVGLACLKGIVAGIASGKRLHTICRRDVLVAHGIG
jgi:hypothetical protein